MILGVQGRGPSMLVALEVGAAPISTCTGASLVFGGTDNTPLTGRSGSTQVCSAPALLRSRKLPEHRYMKC